MTESTGMISQVDLRHAVYGARTPLVASAVPELVMDPVTSISISDIWRIVRRNLWWIALTTMVVVVGVAVALRYVTPTYRAEAVLEVAPPLPPIPSDFPSTTQQPQANDDATVNSEVDAVLSVPVLEKVVKALQLERDPEFNPFLPASRPSGVWPPLAAAWGFVQGLPGQIQAYLSPGGGEPASELEHRLVLQNLERALSVSVKSRSRVLVVKAESEVPDKAAALANAVAQGFLENRLEAKVDYSNQLSAWLNKRLAELRTRMGQREQDVQRRRTALGQYRGMTSTLLSEQLSHVDRQLIDAEAEMSAAQSRYGQIKRLGQAGQDIGAANDVLASPLIRSLRLQREELLTQKNEKLELLGPRHPDVRNLNSQLTHIDRAITTQIARISKNAADDLNVVRARVTALEKAKTDLEKRMDAQNVGLVDVEQLQRDADTERKAYEAFAVFRDKTAGLNTLQPEAELLSRAILPLRPASPHKLLILALGGSITLLLSLIAAFVRETLDQRFRSAQDVAAILGLRTLALVPRVKGQRHPETYVTSAPRSAIAESIRYLYAELDRASPDPSPDSEPFKILISSSLQGEGKSTTAMMLAREASTNGRKTLLVNLDIRHAEGSNSHHGREACQMQKLLEGGRLFEPCVTIEPMTGLARLSFRTTLGEPFKLLYTPQFWSDLSAITSGYELVIIDSPPILSVPDAKLIATFAHKTVFLIKWASTKRETATEGLRHFRGTGADIFGAVLTQVDPKKYAKYEDNYVRGYLGKHKATPTAVEL